MNSIDFFNNNKKISLKKLFPKNKIKKRLYYFEYKNSRKIYKKRYFFF